MLLMSRSLNEFRSSAKSALILAVTLLFGTSCFSAYAQGRVIRIEILSGGQAFIWALIMTTKATGQNVGVYCETIAEIARF